MPTRRFFLALAAASCTTKAAMPPDTVFEFRNYTLHPGQRDTLIRLFEAEFIEPQDALGARVVATFRDLDHPNRFVWIRSFRDFSSRQAALEAFYGGDVWRAHRSAANATMIDADDVLLLRPIGRPVLADPALRPPRGAEAIPRSLFVAATYFVRTGDEARFAEAFADAAAPRLTEAAGRLAATFETEPRENNFPRLPVRTDGPFFLSLTRFDSVSAHAHAGAALAEIDRALAALVRSPPNVLRLQPTARSLLR